MGKRIVLIVMLLATLNVARAFSFSQQAPTGQKLYYDVVAGGVKVVNPDWDSYTRPSGGLEIPAMVTNDGTTYNVIIIGHEAFDGCTGLTRVVVPEGVTSIEGFAFYGCSSLDTIVLPSTLTEILSQAFSGTGYARNADNRSADGLLYIGQYLIGGAAVADITIADGTLGVAGMACYYNHTVSKVTLPASMRFLAGQSFASCSNLDTIHCLGDVPPQLDYNTFDQTPQFVVVVPCGAGNAYRAEQLWAQYTIVEDTCPTNAIDQVGDMASVKVSIEGHSAVVSGAEGRAIKVYDMTGRCLAEITKASVQQRVWLPVAGVYVVMVEGCRPHKVCYSR